MFDFKTGVASTSSTKSRRVEQLESRGERGKEIGSVELPSSPIAISCVWGRAAITDLDGDLLTQSYQTGMIFIETTPGGFIDVSEAKLPQLFYDNPNSLAVGDVDGDGDVDIVAGQAGVPNALVLGDGPGAFVDGSQQMPVDFASTENVELADFDGDRDLDVFFASRNNYQGQGAQSRLALNDGASTFVDATDRLPQLAEASYSVGSADFDLDGDQDVLVGGARLNRLLANDGAASFSDASALIPLDSELTKRVGVADLDSDGDSDVVLIDDLHARTLFSVTHQSNWRGLPRVGKPLGVDLFASPASPWVLAAAFGTVSLPAPPFGVLQLDSSTLLVLAGGQLDATGRAGYGALVPPTPGLVGQSVYWQALLGSPLAFTNLEPTVFTAY